MANWSQNISNTVRCFSEGPSTKWGQAIGFPYTMTWGTSKWGEGLKPLVNTRKVISNAPALTWEKVQASAIKRTAIGSIAPTYEMTDEGLTDGSHIWSYVFPLPSTEAESRNLPVWSAGAAATASFSCAAAGSTTWT